MFLMRKFLEAYYRGEIWERKRRVSTLVKLGIVMGLVFAKL